MVIKSLSIWLREKDCIFSFVHEVSLAGYKILGSKLFSLTMLNNAHQIIYSLLACRVSAERSAVSLMGFLLWITQPFSLASLNIFPFISTLVNLTIMCLGLLFLRSIFAVFSVFPELECWPVFLDWGSSPG